MWTIPEFHRQVKMTKCLNDSSKETVGNFKGVAKSLLIFLSYFLKCIGYTYSVSLEDDSFLVGLC